MALAHGRSGRRQIWPVEKGNKVTE
jgi:two-component system, OmpR family, response regulator